MGLMYFIHSYCLHYDRQFVRNRVKIKWCKMIRESAYLGQGLIQCHKRPISEGLFSHRNTFLGSPSPKWKYYVEFTNVVGTTILEIWPWQFDILNIFVGQTSKKIGFRKKITNLAMNMNTDFKLMHMEIHQAKRASTISM